MPTDTPEKPEQLYAAQEPIFPRRVKGFFRSLKWWIMAVALGIYFLTPWVRWDRGPNLPDQAVLVDLAERRFFFREFIRDIQIVRQGDDWRIELVLVF